MHRGWQMAALLSLAAFLTPFGLGAAVALHLAVSHESHHDDLEEDLRVILHGHSHDKTTPAHGHPLIDGQSSPWRDADARVVSPSLPLVVDYVAWLDRAGQRLALSFAPGRTGVGPPPVSRRQTILRV